MHTTTITPVTMSTMIQPTEASTSSDKGIVMKPATQRKTDNVINQLLDIDMPQENEQKYEYEVPLAPAQIHVQPPGNPPNDANAEKAVPDVAVDDIKLVLLPTVLGTAIKIETPSSNENPPQKESIQNCRVQTQEEILKK